MFNIFYNTNIARRGAIEVSLYFVVVAIVLSAVSFLLLLDNSKKYRVETSVMFIPKSEKAAEDSEHIIENMRVLPAKLAFYDKLLRDNKNIDDAFSGLSDDQRKKMWNDEIKVEREKNSSIIDISITKRDSGEAKATSKATVSTLLSFMSFYYDIKNDVDFRIVEGSIVHASVSNWFLLIVLSLLIGTAASIILNVLFGFASDYFSKNKIIPRLKISKDFFKIKSETRKEIEKSFFIKTPKKEEAKKPARKAPVSEARMKKSPAPENLPSAPGNLSFIDEDYFRNNIIKSDVSPKEETSNVSREVEQENSQEEKTSTDKETSSDLHREPTQEELKKRLNQLLRGEL